VEFTRTVYWNKERGTQAPLDELLGITRQSYSPGVREIICRLCLNDPFVPAVENLLRTAQLDISHSVVRGLAEAEGRRAYDALAKEQLPVGWTAADCTEGTLISGLDGVMVPTVTETQKQQRRAAEAQKRQKEGRQSTAKAGRPKKGADDRYKEFKVFSFYDTDKRHLYTLGTSAECHEAGKRMRREALRLRIGQAQHKYSVSDGAPWIAKQYAAQLPMLEANILDYYHLRDYVIRTSQVLHGEGTSQSIAWREEMMGYVWNQGSLVMLDHLANYLRRHHSGPKAEALKSLREYVAMRVNMTDYPSYRQLGYDCGSGPTESCCGTLTRRLKGRGMRWDRDNAESMMALAGLRQSRLWSDYWAQQRAA
jgi:hypothetical protein